MKSMLLEQKMDGLMTEFSIKLKLDRWKNSCSSRSWI